MFTEEKIKDYANKLLFDLSDDETKLLLDEFDVINENMDLIASIPGINEIKPLSFPQEISVDVLREDTDTSCLDTSDVLKNSDDVIEDVVCVPKVVG